MKHLPLYSLCLTALLSFSSAAVVTVDTATPTVDGEDIANLSARTGGNLIWSDRPMQGQSFTTGASAGGYSLNSVSFIMVDADADPGPANLIEGWKDWRVRVATLSGTTETPIIDTVTRYEPDATDDNYFTVTFDTPISLSSSTQYGFSLGIQNSDESWPAGIPSLSTTGDLYGGGQRYSTQNTNSITSMANATASFDSGSDLVFHLDIAAVPEPSSLALVVLFGFGFLLRRRR